MDDRALRIGVAFARQAAGTPAARLCRACVEILRVSGAGVTVMSGDNSGPVCASNARVGRLEDLQFALGEGPCHDAFASGQVVSEPDLGTGASTSWPLYRQPALELGACAVFAFPLTVGTTRIGVLTVYQDRVGALTDEQIADGLITADVLAETMASIQARSTPPMLSGELSDLDAHRAEVHQASGIIAVQLGVSVAEALVRIRAHAYGSERPVAAVAQEIVAHRLTLDDDGMNNSRE
jgi:GAF domain/ANTAR domain